MQKNPPTQHYIYICAYICQIPQNNLFITIVDSKQEKTLLRNIQNKEFIVNVKDPQNFQIKSNTALKYLD